MNGKVLVVIDDNEVRIHSTPGTDVICIVDGESMMLPDNWIGALTQQVTHQMPISVSFDQMFAAPEGDCPVELEPGIFVVEEETITSVSHSEPKLLDGRIKPFCHRCSADVGTQHKSECPDQNPLVEGGKIVTEQQCLL